MGRWIKNIGLGLGIGIFLVMLVIYGGIAYLNSPAGQTYLRDVINAHIPGAINWQDLTLKLAAGNLTLEQLTIRDPDGRTALAADHAVLDLDWRPLFRRQLLVRRFEVNALKVDLYGPTARELNLLKAFSTPSAQPPPPDDAPSDPWPFDVRVERLQVTRGDLRLAEGAAWPDVHLERIELSAVADSADASADVTLGMAQGTISRGGRQVILNQLNVHLPLTRSALAPLKLDLGLPGGQLAVEGEIRDPLGAAALALQAKVEGDVAPLAGIWMPETPLTGHIQAQLDLQGSPRDPQLSLSLKWSDGGVGPIPWNSLDGRFRYSQRTLSIEALELEAFGGSSRLWGVVSPNGPEGGPAGGPEGTAPHPPAYELNLTLSDIAAAQLPGGARLPSARLNGTVKLAGEGLTPAQLDADLSGQVNAVFPELPAETVLGLVAPVRKSPRRPGLPAPNRCW